MRIFIIVGLLLLAGCSRPVVLYPIEKADIYRIRAGECGSEKDGWFVSDFYIDEVMEAKVEQ